MHFSWLNPNKERKLTVVGSKKMAVFDDMEPRNKIKVYDKGFDKKTDYNYKSFFSIRQGSVRIPRFGSVEPLKLECQHFVDSILTGKKPFTDEFNGLSVLSVLEAAQKSLKNSGKSIKVKRYKG